MNHVARKQTARHVLAATGMHSSRTDMLSRAAKLAGNVFPLPHIERVEALIRPSTVKSCANFGCTLQQGDCSLAVHVCCLSDVTCALADAVAAACAATLAVLIPGWHAGRMGHPSSSWLACEVLAI